GPNRDDREQVCDGVPRLLGRTPAPSPRYADRFLRLRGTPQRPRNPETRGSSAAERLPLRTGRPTVPHLWPVDVGAVPWHRLHPFEHSRLGLGNRGNLL